ncbi:MAG TPA: hypothetical protein VIZ22_03700 [Candidatus Limnocylindrales bacterium]
MRSTRAGPAKAVETWQMPVQLAAAGAIIVVAAEDERFGGALRRATELATKRGEPLLLYDWDAPSFLAEPLPTWWSSEGSRDQLPDRLDPEQLRTAGRGALAAQVDRARDSGVEAFGWLPSDHGPGPLADYAGAQGASIVVVPRDLTELHGLDALINGTARPADELVERASAAVVIV